MIYNWKDIWKEDRKGGGQLPSQNRIVDRQLHRMAEYRDLAVRIWRWKGIDPEDPVTARAARIESIIFDHWYACAFVDEVYGFMVAPVDTRMGFGPYGEPVRWSPHVDGLDAQRINSRELTDEDSVLIAWDSSPVPVCERIRPFVEDWVAASVAARRNILYQNYPWFVQSSENDSLLIKNVAADFDEGLNVVAVKNTIIDNVKANTLTVPMIADALLNVRDRYDADVLEILGVNNLNVEKRERLIVDEANANAEEMNIRLADQLETRKRACELIRRRLGVDVDVELAIGGIQAEKEDQIADEDGGDGRGDPDDGEEDRRDREAARYDARRDDRGDTAAAAHVHRRGYGGRDMKLGTLPNAVETLDIKNDTAVVTRTYRDLRNDTLYGDPFAGTGEIGNRIAATQYLSTAQTRIVELMHSMYDYREIDRETETRWIESLAGRVVGDIVRFDNELKLRNLAANAQYLEPGGREIVTRETDGGATTVVETDGETVAEHRRTDLPDNDDPPSSDWSEYARDAVSNPKITTTVTTPGETEERLITGDVPAELLSRQAAALYDVATAFCREMDKLFLPSMGVRF